MFKLWKRVCAGMLAAVTLGVTLLPGVEVHAATNTETENLMRKSDENMCYLRYTLLSA